MMEALGAQEFVKHQCTTMLAKLVTAANDLTGMHGKYDAVNTAVPLPRDRLLQLTNAFCTVVETAREHIRRFDDEVVAACTTHACESGGPRDVFGKPTMVSPTGVVISYGDLKNIARLVQSVPQRAGAGATDARAAADGAPAQRAQQGGTAGGGAAEVVGSAVDFVMAGAGRGGAPSVTARARTAAAAASNIVPMNQPIALCTVSITRGDAGSAVAAAAPTAAAGAELPDAPPPPQAPQASDSRYVLPVATAGRADKTTMWDRLEYSSDEDTPVGALPLGYDGFGFGFGGGDGFKPPYGIWQGVGDVVAVDASNGATAAASAAAAADGTVAVAGTGGGGAGGGPAAAESAVGDGLLLTAPARAVKRGRPRTSLSSIHGYAPAAQQPSLGEDDAMMPDRTAFAGAAAGGAGADGSAAPVVAQVLIGRGKAAQIAQKRRGDGPAERLTSAKKARGAKAKPSAKRRGGAAKKQARRAGTPDILEDDGGSDGGGGKDGGAVAGGGGDSDVDDGVPQHPNRTVDDQRIRISMILSNLSRAPHAAGADVSTDEDDNDNFGSI